MNGHAPSAIADGEGAQQQQQQQEEEEEEDAQLLQELQQLPPALQLDELAAAAAARALALKEDTTKGARARKKKALTDFLGALKQVGYSQRSTDIAAGDRDAAAWFKHSRPRLGASSVLQPLPAPSAAAAAAVGAGAGASSGASAVSQLQLALAQACWSKADASYYRALARWQQLEAAAAHPAKDLAAHEVNAAVRYCRHQLYVLRQQRDLLGAAAAGYGRLQQVVGWLQRLVDSSSGSSEGQAAPPPAAAAAAATNSVLPPQQWAKQWLLDTKQHLDGLVYLLTGQLQLLTGLQALPWSASWQQQLAAAGTAVEGALQRASAGKAAVDGEVDQLQLTGCPVVDWAAVACLQSVFADLLQSCNEVEAAVAGDAGQSLTDLVIPGWHQLQDVLRFASRPAADFNQQLQQQQQEEGHGSASADSSSSINSSEQLQGAATSFAAALEQLLEASLIWCQGGAVTSATSAAPAAPPTAAAAAGEGVGAWNTQAAAALRPGKLQEASDAAAAALAALATVSDAAHAAAASSSSAAAGLSRAMLGQLGAALPLLQLLAGGVQQRVVDAVVLHKSCAKLAYVSTSLFCTLVKEGYCMPEGTEVEGGEGGEGEWKEAGGTGMGDGTGKKDVSDQIKDEDQLLGAQQKGQQQEGPQEEQDLGHEEAAGVEMEGDFEGQLHDVDKQQQAEDEEGDSEEGDEERLDQQMGEVSGGGTTPEGEVCVCDCVCREGGGGEGGAREERGCATTPAVYK
jgi:midasin